MNDWVNGRFEFEDTPETRDPEIYGEDAEGGLKISKVSFDELVSVFPNTTQVSSGGCKFKFHESLNVFAESRAKRQL
jgi:hypothetical protein